MSVAGEALIELWLDVPLVSLSRHRGRGPSPCWPRHFFRDAMAARFPAFVERVDRGITVGLH